MIKCIFPTDVLILFLKRKIKNMNEEMPPELKKHIQNCPACKKLVQDNNFARAFLKFDSRLSKTTEPEKIAEVATAAVKPGQIIEFTFGDSETAFAAVTSEPFSAHENIPEAVRISPLTLAPHSEEISENDIILPSAVSGLKTPALLEFWNERPILIRQIKKITTNLPPELLTKVFEAIRKPPAEAALNSKIKAFRHSRMQLGVNYSDDVFKNLGEFTASYCHAERLASAIKIVFKRVKKVLCSFSFELPIACSEPVAVFHSASEPATENSIEDFYCLLLDILKSNSDLPFRLRLKENLLTISNTEGRKFGLEIQLKKNKSLVFNSFSDTVKLNSFDLKTWSQNNTSSIIFEET